MQSTPNVTAIFVLGVAAVFSMVSLCARIAYDAGSNALTVITLRIVLPVPVLWLFLRARRASWRFPSSDRNRALTLAFSGIALTLHVKDESLDITGLTYAIAASGGWGLLKYLTGWSFHVGDSRPRTLHMMLSAAVLRIVALLIFRAPTAKIG